MIGQSILSFLSRYAILLLLVLLAFALRLHTLDAVPLRGDEAYSVQHWTATPFSEPWQQLIRQEPAPLGAFTLYWAWVGAAGRAEFAVRYLSVLGSVAGLAVAVALAKRLLGDWRLALLAGTLWAVHPLLIWHAQDARVYGVLSLLTPLSFYWLLRALDGRRGGLRPWRPYIVTQTAALYLYYLEPFWMVAQGLFVLLCYPDQLRRALRAWGMVLLLAIPVLAQLALVMTVGGYQGNAEPASLSLLFSQFMPTLLFGDSSVPVWLGLLTAVGLLAGFAGLARHNRRAGTLLLLWFVVPLLLLVLASFVSDFFRPRYVLMVVPALVIGLVGMAAAAVPHRRSLWAALALVIVVGGVSLMQVRQYFQHDPPKAADWPGRVAYLQQRMTPADVLITGQPDPAAEYYFSGPGSLFIIPLDDDAQRLESDLDRLLERYDGLYLLADPRTAAAEDFLARHAQPIPGDTWPGLSQHRRWTVHPREIAQPLRVAFGDVAVLRGYTLLDTQTLLLFWEAGRVTDDDHSVLLHIERAGEVAPPVAVLDHGLAGAVVSTRTWTPGAIYRDPVALPDLPPGEYVIYTGFYHTASGHPVGEARHRLTTFTVSGAD